MNNLRDIVIAIARVGVENQLLPPACEIIPFSHFFVNGEIDRARLDERDGCCTR